MLAFLLGLGVLTSIYASPIAANDGGLVKVKLVNPPAAPIFLNMPQNFIENKFSIIISQSQEEIELKTLGVKLKYPSFKHWSDSSVEIPENDRDHLIVSVQPEPWPVVAKLWARRKKAQFQFLEVSEFNIDEFTTRDELAAKEYVTYRVFYFEGDENFGPLIVQCHAGKPKVVMCQMTGEIKNKNILFDVSFLKVHMPSWRYLAEGTVSFMSSLIVGGKR